MSDNSISDRAFAAALDAAHEHACDDLEVQLKAAILAYLEILHVHVTEDTPAHEYTLTASEADNLFKPRDFEIED